MWQVMGAARLDRESARSASSGIRLRTMNELAGQPCGSATAARGETSTTVRSESLDSRTDRGFRVVSLSRDPTGAAPMQLPDLTMWSADGVATLGSRAISGPVSGHREVRIHDSRR